MQSMEKIHLGPGLGELEDGSDPAMSVGVATERADGVQFELSGLVHPDGSPVEQAETIFEMIEDIVGNDLGGSLGDVLSLRFYVRDDSLTDDVRQNLHELRRDVFDAPEYPTATMVGVSSLVHDDATVEIEASGFVPDEKWDVSAVFPEE